MKDQLIRMLSSRRQSQTRSKKMETEFKSKLTTFVDGPRRAGDGAGFGRTPRCIRFTKPMIVVMANGYASRTGYQVPDLRGKPFGSPEMMKVMQERMSAFEDDMTQVLIPFIDKTFRTIADREHRAMAGLSMGGMQTFQVTFDHLDQFSYIGGFGGAPNVFATGNEKLETKTAFHGAMADPSAFAKRVHLLWIGVGTDEPERMKRDWRN
jgi:enterochelin esterase-like enzyme